jgi:hypothetical protein
VNGPTECELIELEDWLIYQFNEPHHNSWLLSDSQAIERIKTLIAIARAQAPPIPPMLVATPRKVKPKKRRRLKYLTNI